MKLSLAEHKRKHPKDIDTAQTIAFVVKRAKVVAVGYNRRIFPKGEVFSIHAEDAALKKAGRQAREAVLYVFRFKKGGSTGMAMPCLGCFNKLNRAGIVRVFFSMNDTDKMGRLIWEDGQWTRR